MDRSTSSLKQLEDSPRQLLRQLLVLSLPIFAEHALHILVGWNDSYLANHLHRYDVVTSLTHADENAAGAAVGTMAYILWFIGLLVSAVATGSTALIARAVGARHRRLANSVCGQSILLAVVGGIFAAIAMYVFAPQIAGISGLNDSAKQYALQYLHILAPSLPLTLLMFVANACLRGAGDTLSPARTMIVVDLINMGFSFGLTYGWCGLPRLGFNGIAWGTMIAYISGGVIQLTLLLRGRAGLRLFPHRLKPAPHNIKRVLRVGLPGAGADALQWLSNSYVLFIVNAMGAAAGNAHSLTIRVESLSYMMGFAVAAAATTMVGQSLGMLQPRRAQHCAWLAYLVGGGIMVSEGIGFIFFSRYPAMLLSNDLAVRALVAHNLFVAGLGQAGFAAAMIFGGALRGAGDTVSVMCINLISQTTLRVGGVWWVTHVLHGSLTAIWIVLTVDQMSRGTMTMLWFVKGKWKTVKV